MNKILEIRNPLTLVLCLLVVLVAYASSLTSLHSQWSGNGAYSHGYLAAMVAAYFLVQHAEYFKQSALARINKLGLFGLVFSGILWWCGWLADILLLQQVAVASLVLSFLIAFYGFQVLLRLWVPISIVLLALPVWDIVKYPLRVISTDATDFVLTTIGIPFLREGFRIDLISGQFVVANSCSGLGFLLSAISFAIIFGEMFYLSFVKRMVFLALGICVALVSNWIRISSIILIGHYTEMQHPWVEEHLFYGWLLFSVALVPLFYFGYRLLVLPELLVAEKKSQNPSKQVSQSFEIEKNKERGRVIGVKPAVLVCAILVAFPTLSVLLMGEPNQTQSSILGLPTANDIVPEKVASFPNWQPVFHGATEVYRAVYSLEDMQANAYLAYYAHQSQGKELIYVKNALFNEYVWEVVKRIQDESGIEVLVLKNAAGDIRYLGYSYQLGGYATYHAWQVKLLQIWMGMRGKKDGYVIALMVDEKNSVIKALNEDIKDKDAKADQLAGLIRGVSAHLKR